MALAANNREYTLEGLSDDEMASLFKKLIAVRLIRPLTDEEIRLAVDWHGRVAKRRLLVLILELTRGKKIRDVIRDEIDRVRNLGDDLLSAYRYICVMASVQSFLTVDMLKDLVHVDNVTLDIIARLPGLVELVGSRVYARHARIGEIATAIFFENADEQRCETLRRLTSLALTHNELDVVRSIRLDRTVPETCLFSVANHLLDEAYCAGHYDLVLSIFEELRDLEFQLSGIFEDLLAAKTPVIWDSIIFPASQTTLRMKWDESTWGFKFLWPKCDPEESIPATSDSSVENKLKWASIFDWAATWAPGNYETFFTVITHLMYALSSALHQDRAAEIDFEHAEFLRRTDQYDNAVARYQDVLQGEPANAKAHAGLSLAYYMAGKYPEALHHYKSAKQIDWHSLFYSDDGLFDEMLERLGELSELIEYRKLSIHKHSTGIRAIYDEFGRYMRVTDLTPVGETSPQDQRIVDPILPQKYTEEAELATLNEMDELLEFVSGLSDEQRQALGKRISRAKFGELRHFLKSSSTSDDQK